MMMNQFSEPTFTTTYSGAVEQGGNNNRIQHPLSFHSTTSSSNTVDNKNRFHEMNGLIRFSDVRRDDVLLGRGTGPNENTGNVRFRKLVWKTLVCASFPPSARTGCSEDKALSPAPTVSSGQCKVRLACQIIQAIHARGGRFLQRASISATTKTKEPAGTVVYYREVTDDVAIEKTVQSFRHQLRSIEQQEREGSRCLSFKETTETRKRGVEETTVKEQQPQQLQSSPPPPQSKRQMISPNSSTNMGRAAENCWSPNVVGSGMMGLPSANRSLPFLAFAESTTVSPPFVLQQQQQIPRLPPSASVLTTVLEQQHRALVLDSIIGARTSNLTTLPSISLPSVLVAAPAVTTPVAPGAATAAPRPQDIPSSPGNSGQQQHLRPSSWMLDDLIYGTPTAQQRMRAAAAAAAAAALAPLFSPTAATSSAPPLDDILSLLIVGPTTTRSSTTTPELSQFLERLFLVFDCDREIRQHHRMNWMKQGIAATEQDHHPPRK